MVPNILVFDDAISNFEHVRDFTLSQETGDVTSPVDGRVYKGVSVLGAREREEFTILATTFSGLPLRCNLAAIRTNDETNTTEDGLIHADVGHGDFASVLYITDPPSEVDDGTMFWKHRETGLEFNPITTHIPDELLPDLNNPDKWKQAGFVAAKSNRLLLYPTIRFHSRWPALGWSKDGQSRTIIVAFYDLVSK